MTTFHELRLQNLARCERWHKGGILDPSWTGADWSNAMCGEAGEAANVVKKLRRIDTGAANIGDPPKIELVNMLANELGDVIAYADLLAAKYGIDLGLAVAWKFNIVSERHGFPERL